MRLISILVTSAIALSITTGCTQKRPDMVAQNAADGLEDVSSFPNLKYKVDTGKPITKGILSTANKVDISDDINEFNNFSMVEYKTKAPNFDDVPFRAKDNTKNVYELRYQLSENYLTVYKVAPKKYIPFQETTYANEVEDGKLAVPLFGYPVKEYVNFEHAVDEDNRATNKLIADEAEDWTNAKYVKINYKKKVYFEQAEKINIFPKKFFIGKDRNEWFVSMTLVDAKTGAGTIGQDLTVDDYIQPAARIKFVASANELRAIDLNIDEKVLKDGDQKQTGGSSGDDIEFDTVVRFPINFVDFRRATETAADALKEKKLDDTSVDARDWEKRDYISIDFKKVISILFKSDKDEGILEDLSISKDFFGFTLYHRYAGYRFRYSFKRATAPIEKPRVAWEEDTMYHFGFLPSNKEHFIQSNHTRRKEYFENSHISKHYPRNGKIVYHFSDITPKKAAYRDAARKNIAEWNKVFMKEANIQIVLDESKDVAVGDNRYNTINLVDDYGGSRLLGYGPSTVDPLTGEIVSSTANVYVGSMKYSLHETLKKYIYYKLDVIDKEPMFVPKSVKEYNKKMEQELGATQSPIHLGAGSVLELGKTNLEIANTKIDVFKKNLKESGVELTQTDDYCKHYTTDLIDLGLSPTGKICESAKEINKLQSKIKTRNLKLAHKMMDPRAGKTSTCGFSNSFGDLEGKIKSRCGNLHNYIQEVKALNGDPESEDYKHNLELIKRGDSSTQFVTFIEGREKDEIDACIEELVPEMIEETLLHELGHNFGLRHNFAASSDPKNFRTTDVFSSSTMDYLSPMAPPILAPGPYDAAAVRFAYAGKVELGDEDGNGTGNYIDIDPEMSLDDFVEKKGITLRKFKYCTDMQLGGNSYETYCDIHDWGRNHFENTVNRINSFNSYLAFARSRLDKYSSLARNASLLGHNSFFGHIMPMLKTYSEWRYKVSKHPSVNKANQHLEYFSPDDYDRIVKDILAGDDEEAKDLYKSAEAIVELLQFWSRLPNLYCLFEEASGSINVVELDYLRGYLGDNNIQSCSHEKVTAHLAKQGRTVIDERGFRFRDAIFEKNLEKKSDYVRDLVGFGDLIAKTKDAFSASAPTTLKHQHQSLQPIISQEPSVREKMTRANLDRILLGLPVSKLGLTPEEAGRTHFPVYKSQEAEMKVLYINARLMSRQVIDKSVEEVLHRRFKMHYTKDFNKLKNSQAITWVKENNGFYQYAEPYSTFTIELIDKQRELSKLKSIFGLVGPDEVFSQKEIEDFLRKGLELNQGTLAKEQISPKNLGEMPVVDIISNLKKLLKNAEIKGEEYKAGLGPALSDQWHLIFNDLLRLREIGLSIENPSFKTTLGPTTTLNEYMTSLSNEPFVKRGELVLPYDLLNKSLDELISSHVEKASDYLIYRDDFLVQESAISGIFKSQTNVF